MQQQRALSIEDICRKLKPIYGDKIDKVYFNYLSSESRESKEEVATMLHALYEKHFDNLLDFQALLTPPKQASVLSGAYPIGQVLYGNKELFPFSLREQDMPRHVCITGMSGSGKTTLAYHILEGLIEDDKPFLVFDWKKSFRPLLAKDPSLTCFTVGDSALTNKFKLNINEPPRGISPKEWITVLCDLIAESFFVSYGVHKVLLETLDSSYKEWGVYKGSSNYPTWNHIKWKLEQRLEKAKSREAGWIESALRVATVLTFGDFGEVVNYKGNERIDVEEILQSRVLFELNALGSIEKKFFCEFLLMYIYKLKKSQENKVSRGFDHAILVDEAHNIFLKNKTNFTSESVTDMIYREMREYGTSLICLDQHISKLSDTVTGNSACHIAFQQQLPEDIDDISRLMHLPHQKDLFSSLTIGQGVVKLSERYTQPFLISTQDSPSRNNRVTDSEILSRVQSFLTKQDYMHGRDQKFSSAVEQGGYDINQLFSNIKLPRQLDLYATKHDRDPLIDKQEYKITEPTKEPTLMSDTIYATIKRRLASGEDIVTIEKTMEAIYEPSEVEKAMNQVLNEELHKHNPKAGAEPHLKDVSFSKIQEPQSILPIYKESEKKVEKKKSTKVTTDHEQKQNTYKLSLNSSKYDGLSKEEELFVSFLSQNPRHELTTVNLYKKLNLSPRKGNKVKSQLQDKGLLTIEEVRDETGWKKFIRLA